ncbi:MAG TPA: phosphotransferase [Chryseosolibacter sp.]
MQVKEILREYSINEDGCRVEALTGGLINGTWKVSADKGEYILQRINTAVFKNPEAIAQNLELISEYLKRFPNYLFVGPIKNNSGNTLTVRDSRAYRIFPFINNTHTIDKVTTADEAYEAAAQFGQFTYMLKDFDAGKLEITIPDFHNLTLRYSQFLQATESGNIERIKQAAQSIKKLKQNSSIVEEYNAITKNQNFPKRVTHHDTKISNVLFDNHSKGVCVIDLDTVMPGYFFSDVGDMMRTYLSPSTEEETDFSKITIRPEVYEAIVNGYRDRMRQILTQQENQKFFYSGTFMIYMQALRFITDFLNNDVYYGAKYPDHNFNRAGNQVALLERLIEQKGILTQRR